VLTVLHHPDQGTTPVCVLDLARATRRLERNHASGRVATATCWRDCAADCDCIAPAVINRCIEQEMSTLQLSVCTFNNNNVARVDLSGKERIDVITCGRPQGRVSHCCTIVLLMLPHLRVSITHASPTHACERPPTHTHTRTRAHKHTHTHAHTHTHTHNPRARTRTSVQVIASAPNARRDAAAPCNSTTRQWSCENHDRQPP
jgi:hypothetical protein